MSDLTRLITIFLVTLSVFPYEGSSLICYSCSASTGHRAACENITQHLDEISHHECLYNEAVCATYKIQYGGDVMIFRSCKNANICWELGEKLNSQYNRILTCETCNFDLCNSATRNTFSTLVYSSIITMFFMKFS